MNKAMKTYIETIRQNKEIKSCGYSGCGSGCGGYYPIHRGCGSSGCGSSGC